MGIDRDKAETERLKALEAALEEARASLQAEQAESARWKQDAEQIYAEMFSRNTAPKLLIDPETGAIADANAAALDFYGYTLEAIREQRIQDINLLSEAEVAAEREKALHEERRYFEFRHRLANGGIRNVEVYSGPVLLDGKRYLHSIIHDVTERRRVEQERAQVLEILEATPDFVGMVDPAGGVIYLNAALRREIGEDHKELDAVMEAVHPDWVLRLMRQEAMPAAEHKGAWQGESELLDRNGRSIPVSQIVIAHRDACGQVRRYSTIMRDISSWRALEEQLRQETAFSDALLRSLPGVLYLLDAQGRYVRWNRHLEEVTGHATKDFETLDPVDLIIPEERASIREKMQQVFEEGSATAETHLIGASGEAIPYYLRGYRVVLDGENYLLGVGLNISRRKAMEQELTHLATHDPLTGLYNRGKLRELLEQARYEYDRYGTPFSLVMLDIDRFKRVNDRFGHQAGDEVLCELTRRVNHVLRDADSQGRWGGEEFLVLATHTEMEGAAALAERIRQEVERTPFGVVGTVTISLGVATIQEGESLEQLEARVDKALYAAKDAGRNRVVTADQCVQ